MINILNKIIKMFGFGCSQNLLSIRFLLFKKNNFILQAITGNKLTINGDGTQTRSFLYIDDLISAMIKMMNSKDEFIGPVNIGNPIEISMNQLASLIIELSNSKSEIIYKDLPKDDPKRRNPEISKAKDMLNWTPKLKLKTGLLKTISYFKKTNEIG